MEIRQIVVDVTTQESGLFASSRELPGLNVLAQTKTGLINSIIQAIKYLFLHDEQCEVRVFVEIPPEFFDEPTNECRERIEADIKKAA